MPLHKSCNTKDVMAYETKKQEIRKSFHLPKDMKVLSISAIEDMRFKRAECA